MLRLIKILVVVAVMVVGSNYALAQEAQLFLQIKDTVEIRSDYVRIRDIASVVTSDPIVLEKVENIIVRKSPYPGKSFELRAIDVKACLMRNRINAETVEIGGSKTTLVTAKSVTVTTSDITAQARNFVTREMPWDPENVRIEVLSSPSDVVLNAGDLTFEVYPASRNYHIGQVVITVKIFVDGSLKKSIPVSMRVRVFDEVVVVNRALSKEERIDPSCVSLEKREVSGLRGGVFSDINEVVGKVAKRRIKAQRILCDNMVQSPLMIKRNELVKVVLSMKNLKITSRAIARQDGREGDFIAVRNIDNPDKKDFHGLVIGPGLVRVDL